MIKPKTYICEDINKSPEDFFKEILEANDEIIRTEHQVINHCFVLNKDRTVDMIALFGNLKSLKKGLIDFLVSKKILCYVIVLRSNYGQYKNCVIRSLYMPNPNDVVKDIIILKDKIPIIHKNIKGRENFIEDMFDIWGSFDTKNNLIIKG